MTDIVALDKRLKELNDQISKLTEERDKVIAERQAYTNEGIKSYDNFDDIVWEENALNAISAFLSGFLGHRSAGYKPVLVNGKRYRRVPVDKQSPDWYAIGNSGVVDVARKDYWIQLDEPQNQSQEVRNQRAREYNGGLRKPLSTWTARKEGAEMRKAYLETHASPGAREAQYTKRNPSSLSQFGNE